MPVTASARFTEGMSLPPMRVGEHGQLREDWPELFTAYGIRAPQMVVTDLKARSTAADRARIRVVELAEKEGPEFVIGLLRKMLMVAEEGARKRIASLPDGKFRCVAFADTIGGMGFSLVRSAALTVAKRGDHLQLDFTGTSPENPSSYNAHVQAAVGHLANYLYSYIFHDLPISSATFGFASGGAGYGDPLDADPQQVVQDVEAEIVSDWSARTIYKVAYDPNSMRSNQKETEDLRQAERRDRLARGKTWDAFMDEWSQPQPPEEALTWFGSWPEGDVVAPVFRP
jgi:N-methylhydantoinase B/oxoprolinase/acetone carboxylase alpha subunit